MDLNLEEGIDILNRPLEVLSKSPPCIHLQDLKHIENMNRRDDNALHHIIRPTIVNRNTQVRKKLMTQ